MGKIKLKMNDLIIKLNLVYILTLLWNNLLARMYLIEFFFTLPKILQYSIILDQNFMVLPTANYKSSVKVYLFLN